MHAIECVGLVGGILTTSGGIPQILQIARTRQTRDLNWGMIILWAIGLSLTTVYGVTTKQIPVYVSSIASLIQTFIMISCKLRYEVCADTKNNENTDADTEELIVDVKG